MKPSSRLKTDALRINRADFAILLQKQILIGVYRAGMETAMRYAIHEIVVCLYSKSLKAGSHSAFSSRFVSHNEIEFRQILLCKNHHLFTVKNRKNNNLFECTGIGQVSGFPYVPKLQFLRCPCRRVATLPVSGPVNGVNNGEAHKSCRSAQNYFSSIPGRNLIDRCLTMETGPCMEHADALIMLSFLFLMSCERLVCPCRYKCN